LTCHNVPHLRVRVQPWAQPRVRRRRLFCGNGACWPHGSVGRRIQRVLPASGEGDVVVQRLAVHHAQGIGRVATLLHARARERRRYAQRRATAGVGDNRAPSVAARARCRDGPRAFKARVRPVARRLVDADDAFGTVYQRALRAIYQRAAPADDRARAPAWSARRVARCERREIRRHRGAEALLPGAEPRPSIVAARPTRPDLARREVLGSVWLGSARLHHAAGQGSHRFVVKE
jgi:hypothetical protein